MHNKAIDTIKFLRTREEFDIYIRECADKQHNDIKLKKDALDILIRANNHNWLHQTRWMGEPCLQTTEDLFAIQEIIYRVQPHTVIEFGVGWGGSLLFYASCLSSYIMSRSSIIGIDIYIPEDLRTRMYEKTQSRNLYLKQGSSLDKNIINDVYSILRDNTQFLNNIFIFDSNHTHKHVLEELNTYKDASKPGDYFIVCDTIIEDIPDELMARKREWGVGNNPKTALDEFLKENKDFVIDTELQKKLLFSCNTYVKRI